MQYRGSHWHATDNCFSCCTCQKSLLGLPFMPRDDVIFCSKSCADNLGQLIEPQIPQSQFARHSLLIQEDVQESPRDASHNSTFEHLHGESKPNFPPPPPQVNMSTHDSAVTSSIKSSDYTPIIDDYLNSSRNGSSGSNAPTPVRRNRPPPVPTIPKPLLISTHEITSIRESTSERNAMVTIAEQIETIDLRSPSKTPEKAVPPQPTPRKKVRGILKKRAPLQDNSSDPSNFSRGMPFSSSCRSAGGKKAPKTSGYMSEIDPKAAKCSKKLRRTRSTDLVNRKDKLYFEDHADWCSTCTSSSDDSDYDRWDEDTSTAGASVLAKSRPNPQRYTKTRQLSRSTSHGANSSQKKEKGMKPSDSSNPVSEFIYFDDRYEVRRPEWILGTTMYAPDQPLSTSTKKKKKRSKKRCVVQ